MARTAAASRRSASARNAESEQPAPDLRRAGWIALFAAWVFIALSVVSFDPADPPSHLVAVHNDPATNLCGRFGAVVAWELHRVMGIGIWVLLAGVAGFLAVTGMRRPVGHPVLRCIGLLLVAISLSTLHALHLPTLGPLTGAPAGLAATALAMELSPRFSTVGSTLIVLTSLVIGAIVAVDVLVLGLWRLIASLAERGRHVPAAVWATLRRMTQRPRTAMATAGGATAAARRSATVTPARTRGTPVSNLDDPDDDETAATAKAGGSSRRRKAAEPAEVDDAETEAELAEEELEDDEEWEYVDVEVDEDDEEWEDEDEDAEEEDEDEDLEEEEEDADAGLSDEELRQKIARLPVRMASGAVAKPRDADIPRTEDYSGYKFPTLDLLKDGESNFSEEQEQIVRRQAESLERALHTYGIDGEVVGIDSGPAVTLYSVQLAAGTKVSKVSAVSTDIARSLAAQNIRIVPNMVGKTAIGIEVPNTRREKVRLKELMSGGQSEGMVLPMFLGKDASGEPLVADLTKMPHMLIAGTTGSGKSVCMNTILMSWLYTKRPDELKLVLVDPKMVELSQFQDCPHLMCPVVTESGRAAAILEWAVDRMEERYELLKEARVQNIKSYNELTEEDLYDAFEAETDEERARIPKQLPYMVFVIDELADLMMTHKEVEHSIVRIAQKARAVGIHLVLATQRPQANVVTGLIKANMPCRLSFKVASGMDSRIVLDQKGAELLLGQGDMMMITPSSPEVSRAQGTLVEDTEIRKVTRFLKNVAAPSFERSLIALRASKAAETGEGGLDESERDPMFEKAVEVMIETGRGSVSLLQRRLAIGYGRASRLVDQMALAGIIGDHKGSVAREVLITAEDWARMKQMEDAEAREGTVFEDQDD